MQRSGSGSMPVRVDVPVRVGVPVRVEVDGAGREVTVALDARWRRHPGAAGLGPAIRDAFAAAAAARLAAWAEHPAAGTGPAPRRPPIGLPPATPEAVATLSRVWADLREFRVRLAELHGTDLVAAGPGGHVTATARGGQLLSVDVDPAWLPTATGAEVERHAAAALRAVLAGIAGRPEVALEGCPDLRELLAASPTAASPTGAPR